MNKISHTIILFMVFSFLSGSLLAQQNKHKLTVIVDNIKMVSGKLEVSLYNDPKSFPKDNGEYMTKSIPVDSNIVQCIFYVPPGTYAIALYHDANINNICDKNFLGKPLEGFGFSNNVKPIVRAPSFNACKFQVSGDTKIYISLLHD